MLIAGFLLIQKNYQILKWIALFGVVMPITDAVLAYRADGEMQVIIKHIVTILYLLVTFLILNYLGKLKMYAQKQKLVSET